MAALLICFPALCKMSYASTKVHVEDARGRGSEFKLDVHGFQLLNPSANTAHLR